MTKWDKVLAMVDFEVCLHSRFNRQLYKPRKYGFSFRMKLPNELKLYVPNASEVQKYISDMALKDGYVYKDFQVSQNFDVGIVDCSWSEWGPV